MAEPSSTTHTILCAWCRWSGAWESEVAADGNNGRSFKGHHLAGARGRRGKVYLLHGAEEQAAQYKKRARNTVIFYVIAESIWQIKDLILYYYS